MSSNIIKVALDWTPNTIHTGLYVAVAKGFYTSLGLHVELIPVDADYSKTPAKRLENDEVQLAICPSESCIAYNETKRMRLQAIYAILQRNASAIVSTKSKFSTLASLDGGVYGSYNAKYEDHIVRAMVASAGGDAKGQGVRIKSEVGKLSLFEEMKEGTVDSTWIFLPWEGVEAELEGTELHVFKTEDYGVPYGYSPVIARKADGGLSGEALKSFVKATRQGYEYAMEHPEESAAIVGMHCQPPRSIGFLERSQKAINRYYTDGAAPGSMTEHKWKRWVEWLRQQGLLKEDIEINDLYTTSFTS